MSLKIKSYRIMNYKSIKDSGICEMSSDNITILAGMNESGKTSILEALSDFNTAVDIRESAVPVYDKPDNNANKPQIEVNFEVDEDTLKKIKNELKIPNLVTKKMELKVTKKYPEEKRQNSNYYYSDQRDGHAFTNYKISEESLKNLGIVTGNENPVQSKNKGQTDIEDKNKAIQKKFLEWVISNIPNIILFSSFEDQFPSEINLNRAQNNEFIKDLSLISNFNLNLVRSEDHAVQLQHREQINIEIKNAYRQYWTQDAANLHIDWNENTLFFYIKEGQKYFKPEMRSKGRQWHLAFYIKVTARSVENRSNILLIDEPGLYLHPKAQKDILKKLEDSAKDTQIIFTTHSPYLIDVDKLQRIRLVSRDKSGTKISNKINTNAKNETLTPIITAIGMDLSTGLNFVKNNNVLVEGISDYYYLSAFKEILGFNFEDDVHFIPCAGADKFRILIPLIIGWDLKSCVVLDNDQKGRETKKYLLDNFGDGEVKIVLVSRDKDKQIEDLFSEEDFTRYVILDESVKPTKKNHNNKNSQILENNKDKYHKESVSKQFYNERNKIKASLSEETRKQFENLFAEINNALFR
ncbi:ATP-dependent nuclease [Methanosarcina mazei]|nr:AAA family ATPase [Methanosarcina mazei]